MPLILIVTGLLLVITGVKGNATNLYNLVASDFTGPQSFIYWMLAIAILGAIGYIPGLEKFSRLFMILVLIALLLERNSSGQAAGVTFIQTFQGFIKGTTQATTTSGS